MQINESIKIEWRHNLKKRNTLCAITVGDNQTIGKAILHKGDVYVKKEGRKRSLIRAISICKEAGLLDKNARTTIWNVLKEKGVKVI